MQSLSRTRDGLLVVEMDLNLVRQVRDKWGMHTICLSALVCRCPYVFACEQRCNVSS